VRVCCSDARSGDGCGGNGCGGGGGAGLALHLLLGVGHELRYIYSRST
jgi:hypothetical protein